MKQYMGHTVLSLNEVYQIYLKRKKQRKNKIAFVRKLQRGTHKLQQSYKGQRGSNYISHT